MYRIEFTKRAKKDFEKLPKRIVQKFKESFLLIAQNPYLPNNNVKPLKGEDGAYRLRVADYRAVYYIHNNALIIEVVKAQHRKEVYL